MARTRQQPRLRHGSKSSSTISHQESVSPTTSHIMTQQGPATLSEKDNNYSEHRQDPPVASSAKRSHSVTKNSESAPHEKRARIQSSVVHIAYGPTEIAKPLFKNVNVDTKPNGEDLEKEDLETKSNPQLKRIHTQPGFRALYGNALLIATWKANFKRMTYDLLQIVDRKIVPEEFHFLLDEAIAQKLIEKQLAALETVSDKIHKAHFEYEITGDGSVTRKDAVVYKEGGGDGLLPKWLW